MTKINFTHKTIPYLLLVITLATTSFLSAPKHTSHPMPQQVQSTDALQAIQINNHLPISVSVLNCDPKITTQECPANFVPLAQAFECGMKLLLNKTLDSEVRLIHHYQIIVPSIKQALHDYIENNKAEINALWANDLLSILNSILIEQPPKNQHNVPAQVGILNATWLWLHFYLVTYPQIIQELNLINENPESLFSNIVAQGRLELLISYLTMNIEASYKDFPMSKTFTRIKDTLILQHQTRKTQKDLGWQEANAGEHAALKVFCAQCNTSFHRILHHNTSQLTLWLYVEGATGQTNEKEVKTPEEKHFLALAWEELKFLAIRQSAKTFQLQKISNTSYELSDLKNTLHKNVEIVLKSLKSKSPTANLTTYEVFQKINFLEKQLCWIDPSLPESSTTGILNKSLNEFCQKTICDFKELIRNLKNVPHVNKDLLLFQSNFNLAILYGIIHAAQSWMEIFRAGLDITNECHFTPHKEFELLANNLLNLLFEIQSTCTIIDNITRLKWFEQFSYIENIQTKTTTIEQRYQTHNQLIKALRTPNSIYAIARIDAIVQQTYINTLQPIVGWIGNMNLGMAVFKKSQSNVLPIINRLMPKYTKSHLFNVAAVVKGMNSCNAAVDSAEFNLHFGHTLKAAHTPTMNFLYTPTETKKELETEANIDLEAHVQQLTNCSLNRLVHQYFTANHYARLNCTYRISPVGNEAVIILDPIAKLSPTELLVHQEEEARNNLLQEDEINSLKQTFLETEESSLRLNIENLCQNIDTYNKACFNQCKKFIELANRETQERYDLIEEYQRYFDTLHQKFKTQQNILRKRLRVANRFTHGYYSVVNPGV